MILSAWSERRDSITELLRELCVKWGFCISPYDTDRIISIIPLTSDRFAFEMLKAEGFNADMEPEWRRKLDQAFVDRYGRTSI